MEQINFLQFKVVKASKEMRLTSASCNFFFCEVLSIEGVMSSESGTMINLVMDSLEETEKLIN